MRRIFALLLAALLLAGCAAGQTAYTDPAPLTGAEPVGQRGNLWYLPNEAVEAMEVIQLLGAEEGLLLRGSDELKLLDWEDLSVTAECGLQISELASVRILEEGVSIADPGLGTVTMGGFDLEMTDVYSLEPAMETWLTGTDGQTLYRCNGDGLYARDLQTREEETILEPGYLLAPYALTPRALTFVRVGADLRERWYRLELETGTLTELGGSAVIAASMQLYPLENGGYFYRSGRHTNLYGPDGAFLSTCRLDGSEEDQAGYDLVWSDRWDGYFFIDCCGGTSRLMFWDTAVEISGQDVSLALDPVPDGEVLPRELYDRAAELGERFCVELRIADQCQLDYNTFRSRSFDDPQRVSEALDILEQALERYPRGYLEQLRYGPILRIRIELVSGLEPDSDADVSDSAAAFSRERSAEYLIVLDGDVLKETNLHHELAHVADKRIRQNSALRGDALFSEEGWMALQPEGFAYADSYRDVSGDVKAFYDSGYFARDYACVSASEDRATMLECAVMERGDIYDRNPHLMPKLEYYCACIRDSFDTSGWPEVTVWERLLPKN